jgi:hypothetical protein
MKIGEAIGSIIKAALVVGLIYAAVNWQDDDKADDDANLFAKRACVVEIGQRFSVSRIGVYEISENRNGYVVRANVTLAKGSNAKVICLTNRHGGVRDITIEER